MRIVSIESGGDWNDASYDLLEIPNGTDLLKAKKEYDHWYKNEYLPEMKIPFLGFSEWLIKNGGARVFKVEIFNET